MIKVRYLRPTQWVGKDKDYDNGRALSLLLRFCGLSWNLWIGRFNKDGYIHLDTEKVEFLMWNPDRVKPIETAAVDSLKWCEVS